MNVVEVLTDKRVEVWEYLRLDSYGTKMRDRCVFWKWALRPSGRRGEGA